MSLRVFWGDWRGKRGWQGQWVEAGSKQAQVMSIRRWTEGIGVRKKVKGSEFGWLQLATVGVNLTGI